MADALIIAVALLHIAFRARFGRKTASPRAIESPVRMQTPSFRAITLCQVCSPYRHVVELLHETSTVSADGRSRITMRTAPRFESVLHARSSAPGESGAAGGDRRASRILSQRFRSLMSFATSSIPGVFSIASISPLDAGCSVRIGAARRAVFARGLCKALHRHIADRRFSFAGNRVDRG